MINQLCKEIHENNKAKGFHDDEKNIGKMLCLIHSEVSEALECDRKDRYVKPNMAINQLSTARYQLEIINDEAFKFHFKEDVKDTFEDELADIMIRVMDLAAYKGVDLEAQIYAKMRYNSLRKHKHGKKY